MDDSFGTYIIEVVQSSTIIAITRILASSLLPRKSGTLVKQPSQYVHSLLHSQLVQ
jgi:hypothetical protein